MRRTLQSARGWKRRLAVVALSAGLLTVPTATIATSTATAAPGPECGATRISNCWEYYSWYWTYASCHTEGRQQVARNSLRYNDYNCEGGHGAVVWLWLHKR